MISQKLLRPRQLQLQELRLIALLIQSHCKTWLILASISDSPIINMSFIRYRMKMNKFIRKVSQKLNFDENDKILLDRNFFNSRRILILFIKK